MLTSGLYKTALIVGAETLTRFTDPEDRATAILLGDAAGAAVIGRSDDPTKGILYCELGCDGTRADLIIVPAGGSRLPTSEMTVAERLHFMHMRGREVYKFAVNKLQELTDRALENTGLAPNDLKLIIQHQSNLRIIESAREKLGLPEEKVVVNIDRYGNTSSASVIMGLDESRRSGLLQEGDIILLLALGGGLCWASMVVRL
jgi:3-oxoacyl-[acyl-carrier-protein] synthase-3